MKLIKTLILFLSISLLCNNAYCSDSTYVKICRDFITDNLRNLDELNRYAIEHSEKELVKIDTQIYFNDCDLIYLRTWLYSSGYSINLFIDTLSGKCYVINYGNSAYEHYSVKALKKVIKKGRLMFSKLDDRAYFNLIFNLIIPKIPELYSLQGNQYASPTQFNGRIYDSSICNLSLRPKIGDDFLIRNPFHWFNNFIIINARRRKSQQIKIKLIGSYKRFKTALSDMTGRCDNTWGIAPVLKHEW